MTTKTLTIIGGKGQMGQMIYRFLKEKTQYPIHLLDKDDKPDETLLKKSDLVLISVPIDITEKVIQEIAPKLSKDTVLCDFTSIKEKPLNTMLQFHLGPVIGLHPMFGPTIINTENQVIVHCPGRDSQKCQWFIDDLCMLGFQIETLQAKEHDHLMNFIQGIEHFSSFSLGSFLTKQSINLDKLLTLASPVYQMELNILGRLFYQSAELYADIIASDEKRIELLEAYTDHMKKIIEDLKAKKRQKFINTFHEVQEFMGEFCQKAYKETDQTLTKQKK